MESQIIEKIFNSYDLESFKKAVQDSSGLWKEIRKPSGNTLLQELIRLRRFELFNYLLRISDIEYLEKSNRTGQTAITLSVEICQTLSDLKFFCDLYILPLIRKYDVLPSHYHEGNWLLPWAIDGLLIFTEFENTDFNPFLELTELLLQKGMDPNARSTEGKLTNLHISLSFPCRNTTFTTTNLLLLYGANPSLTFHNCNAFEWAVLDRRDPSVCELLFEYTFDHLQTYEVNFLVLLVLAMWRSPLFDRILEYDVKFVVKDVPIAYKVRYDNFRSNILLRVCHHFKEEFIFTSTMTTCSLNVKILLSLKLCHLEILLEKYFCQVRDSLLRPSTGVCDFMLTSIDDNFLKRISLLVGSGATTMDNIFRSVIPGVISVKCFFKIIDQLEKTAATEIVTLLSRYGVRFHRQVFDLVYRLFGCCDLFRLLLRTDYVPDLPKLVEDPRIFMVALYCEPNVDLDEQLRRPKLFSVEKLEAVLDFFADWKVRHFVKQIIKRAEKRKQIRDSGILKKIIMKLERQPKFPSLLEIARDAFRKYVVRSHQYEFLSTRQFYSLVDDLDISDYHKKIICLEQKIYYLDK